MPSTFTTNLNLELQATGENAGTWGSLLNTACFQIIDNALGGLQTLSLAAGNVSVTTTQSQNNAIFLTGALAANRTVTFPAIGRTYFIVNNTTGAFTVTLIAGAGTTTLVIPQGHSGYFTISGNAVYQPTLPGVPTGATLPFAMTTPPTGWLECDGTAVSRTTYVNLFTAIGTTFGPGDGSTTFNLPDLRGEFVRGYDNGRGVDPARVFGSTQASANLAHNHTGTAASHLHQVDRPRRYGQNDNASGNSNPGWDAGDQLVDSSDPKPTEMSGALALTIANDGGTESRPVNVALMWCIRT